MRLIDDLSIFFCTITGIDVVTLYRIFIQGLVNFLNILDMSETKRISPSADEIATMMRREKMQATGAYDTVK